MKPSTVNSAGEASLAWAEGGLTLPFWHARLTVTLAALSGMKSLRISNWAETSLEISTGSAEISERWLAEVPPFTAPATLTAVRRPATSATARIAKVAAREKEIGKRLCRLAS